jgi:hypothetical protein
MREAPGIKTTDGQASNGILTKEREVLKVKRAQFSFCPARGLNFSKIRFWAISRSAFLKTGAGIKILTGNYLKNLAYGDNFYPQNNRFRSPFVITIPLAPSTGIHLPIFLPSREVGSLGTD